MTRGADGVFEAHIEAAVAGSDYWLVADGRQRPDPASRSQPRGVHGPSRVVDTGSFAWSDAAWRGVARADLVIYELHVGTFSDAGTFDGAVEHLDALQRLGVTAIELMPVAEFPGRRNWGYDGVFPYAAKSSYGGPEGLARLVDAAHARGLAVLLDVVYNHLGPEGSVLSDFAPYFTARYRTPWGDALDFDGPASAEVRAYFVGNALYWLHELHLDGLRLDAVQAIHDRSEPHLLAELADAVHELEVELARPLHLVAESDANDPRLVRGREEGGLGLGAVWSDDFHHALHALLTGERDGYYADYGDVHHLAKAFERRFVYEGGHSRFRGRPHGAPATDVPRDRFVVFSQNHDQVGNRAQGRRLAELVSPRRRRLAAALTLLSPYLPLLFMGEEYGETNPFLYFVDHGDPDLIEAVRGGRRAEFASFGWNPDELPDPAAEESFHRSRLDWRRRDAPGHRELLGFYRELLAVRRAEPALRPGASRVGVLHDDEQGWIRLDCRPPVGRPALAAFQLGPARANVPAPGEGGPWRLRLASEDPAHGGSCHGLPETFGPGTASIPLSPESAALYLGVHG